MTRFTQFLVLVVLVAATACTKRGKDEPSVANVPPVATATVNPEPAKKGDAPSAPPNTLAPSAVTLGDRKILIRDCLLRLPKTKQVATTALPGDRNRLIALTDNDAATSALMPATRNLPLDVVYHFGGDEVTPRELVVLLPEIAVANARTARVEVFASSVSADTGFQFLRADPLEETDRVQRFRLRPQVAKWVMIRFVPAIRAERVAVAEVALLGRVGPPESPYAFKESPAKAIDVIEKLKGIAGAPVALSSDEESLIADVKDGKFSKWSFADAALFVSGTREADKRKEYLTKIDALGSEAEKALAGIKNVEERSEKLLRWLHEKALAGGYIAGQTDVQPILDRGQFNCVSSAVLYNVLAKRLGLDVRGIQVPDHAFSIVYEGTKHFDVETTIAEGFNPIRDKAAVAEFESRTGFHYIPDSNRDQRREVTEAGMLAMVYFNHGVDLFNSGRFPAALDAFFCALCLDREQATATRGALTALAAWAVVEGAAGKFTEARSIVRSGLELAPNDARLRYARIHVWANYAQREFVRGGLDAGLTTLREAIADAPDGPFVQLQAWLVIQPGEALVADKKWEEAIALIEPALAKVDPPAREELLRWRGGVFMLWANEEIAAGRFEKALEIVERGLKLHPKDGRFPDLLTAVARNWVHTSYKEKGADGARQVIATLNEKGAKRPEMREAAKRAPYWLVIELQEDGKPDEAEALLADKGPLVPGEVDEKQILRDAFDHWAGSLLDKRDYRGAFGVYVRALGRLPDDPVMIAHMAYVLHRWFGSIEKAEGVEKAKELIARLREENPKLQAHIGLSTATAWTSIRALRDGGQYPEALEALDRFKEVLSKDDEVRNMYHHLYDHWADQHIQKKDHARAVDVYELAVQWSPKDRHVWNNLAATAQEWALRLQAEGQEGEAKSVLLRMLVRFAEVPDVAKIVRDHVPLVVQELRRAGKYSEALATLDRHWDLLQELHGDKAEKERRQIARQVYHVWADTFQEKQQWEKAVEVYEKGFQHLPKDKELQSGAAGVYYDWAKTFRDKKEWVKALEVFEKGIKRLPEDKELTDHAAGVYDQWARTFFEKDWDAAIAKYDEGLKRFPKSSLLKNNREFCEAKKKRK